MSIVQNVLAKQISLLFMWSERNRIIPFKIIVYEEVKKKLIEKQNKLNIPIKFTWTDWKSVTLYWNFLITSKSIESLESLGVTKFAE